MNTNAYLEPALWHKRALPARATCRSPVRADAAIVFGRFRVLLRGRRLLADGVPVELGTRAFDLLLALLEADGSLVTKEELMSRVWPGIVVSEENLKVQISALRKALGVERDVIRTEFGRGYRFTAVLRSNEAREEPENSDAGKAAVAPNFVSTRRLQSARCRFNLR
jgi:DNA-binding winged helix-turn-helix (wHTH) protein